MSTWSNFANWMSSGYDPNNPAYIPFGMTLEDFPSIGSQLDSGTVVNPVYNPLISQEQYHNLKSDISAKVLSSNPNSPVQPSTSAYGAFSGNGSISTPYIDAPLASQYGMNRQTAYQEALANTAHQREIEDLKRAGLNPVLGYSGNGSAVFAGSGAGGGSGSSSRSISNNFDAFASLVGAAVSLATGKTAVGSATSSMLTSAKHLIFDD